MSRLYLKYIVVSLFALLFFSKVVPAQRQLPPLPMDPCIQKGTLGSGVTYYMVTDPSVKGYADIAIVQRDEPLSASKRDGLYPEFLSRMSVAPATDGYLSDADGSTIYRFENIPFYKPEVLDSTLLYTFGLVAQSKAQQAVIVSGDIDAPELKKKMDIFSMLVPRMLVKENHMPDYVWEPSPAPVVQFYPCGRPMVSISYSCSRIPFRFMNTAQALVTDLFGLEFQVLLGHRLERNFREAGIPYGEISFTSARSGDYGGDELYTVHMSVAPEQLHDAMRVMSQTVAEIDTFGIKPEEFVDSKKVLMPLIHKKAAILPAPRHYVSKCISNFLYGANLAPYSETVRLFSRKNVPDSTETRLFNRFADALLEQLSNLKLEYTGAPDSLDRDQELFYYNLSYLYGSVVNTGNEYSWRGGDTLGLNVTCPRIKIKSEKREPVSGGTMWTMSNGMRVIYKQVPGNKIFHYALELNGGLAQIDGLKEGEGGYIGDILSLYDAGGLPAWRFREVMEVNGIGMDTKVDINCMSIQGAVPSENFVLLLKSLLDLANNGKPNIAEFDNYCRSQALKIQPVSSELRLRMVPGFAYTDCKKIEALSPETLKKAQKFYGERFARMNDGVLIISGDLDAGVVKRMICRYLGGFKVLKGTTPRRPVEFTPRAGTVTFTENGPERGLFVLMDAEYPLTADNFYTARVAAAVLEDALVRHLAHYGFNCRVSLTQRAQPQERFGVEIDCMPLPLESLPAQVTEVSAERALSAVRAAIKSAASASVQERDLNHWKAKLEEEMSNYMGSAEGFVKTLLARYAVNKDLTTRYKESIAGINADKVKAFLGAMSAGGRVEYVVE